MAAFYRVDQPDMAARRDDDEPASVDDVAVHVLVQMLIGEEAAKPLGLGKVVGGPVSMVSRSTGVYSSTRSKDSRGWGQS